MVAEGAALVESMDWTAGSIIEDGSAEAAGAEDATVRAVLELPGGGQQREAEDANSANSDLILQAHLLLWMRKRTHTQRVAFMLT